MNCRRLKDPEVEPPCVSHKQSLEAALLHEPDIGKARRVPAGCCLSPENTIKIYLYFVKHTENGIMTE